MSFIFRYPCDDELADESCYEARRIEHLVGERHHAEVLEICEDWPESEHDCGCEFCEYGPPSPSADDYHYEARLYERSWPDEPVKVERYAFDYDARAAAERMLKEAQR